MFIISDQLWLRMLQYYDYRLNKFITLVLLLQFFNTALLIHLWTYNIFILFLIMEHGLAK